jgi:UDP-GlcNAc:undecaprenyl-phosphate/decaprenyl-phosphate GlcNAc-1-phosphate transferase
MNAALGGAIAIFVSWLALSLLLRTGRLPVDVPNSRSLHQLPIPRGGGIAVWAGMLAGSAWLPEPQPWLGPLLLLIAVSLWDDRQGLSAGLRLLAHVLAAVAWISASGLAGVPTTFFAVLLIVWMANLYNFMDGSDGLAATMTVIGVGAYAVAAGRAGAPEVTVLVAVVAATIPFLAMNWPPARILLGDVGAVPLGFLVAVFGIGGWRAHWWPVWFPVLVFLPFITDATLTLGRRMLAGEAIWKAHRDHGYQRLVRMGLGHAGTLAVYAALACGTAVSALATLARAPAAGSSVLVLWIAVLVLFNAGIGYHWHRGNKGHNESKC